MNSSHDLEPSSLEQELIEFEPFPSDEDDLIQHQDTPNLIFKFQDMSGMELTDRVLEGECLSLQNFSWRNFTGSVIRNTRLTLTNLHLATLDKVTMCNIEFYKTKLQASIIRHSNLSHCDFTQIDDQSLRDTNFTFTNISFCNFAGCKLTNTIFDNSILIGSNVYLTDILKNQNLNGCIVDDGLYACFNEKQQKQVICFPLLMSQLVLLKSMMNDETCLFGYFPQDIKNIIFANFVFLSLPQISKDNFIHFASQYLKLQSNLYYAQKIVNDSFWNVSESYVSYIYKAISSFIYSSDDPIDRMRSKQKGKHESIYDHWRFFQITAKSVKSQRENAEQNKMLNELNVAICDEKVEEFYKNKFVQGK